MTKTIIRNRRVFQGLIGALILAAAIYFKISLWIILLIGSVTLIPGFVAFPLAAALLNNGAGFTQIAVFISTLMMVGIVTIPLETKYFGKKAALLRNGMAYIFSYIVALIIGVVLG